MSRPGPAGPRRSRHIDAGSGPLIGVHASVWHNLHVGASEARRAGLISRSPFLMRDPSWQRSAAVHRAADPLLRRWTYGRHRAARNHRGQVFSPPLCHPARSRAGTPTYRLLATASLQKTRPLRSSAALRPERFAGPAASIDGPPSQGIGPGDHSRSTTPCQQSATSPARKTARSRVS